MRGYVFSVSFHSLVISHKHFIKVRNPEDLCLTDLWCDTLGDTIEGRNLKKVTAQGQLSTESPGGTRNS